MNESEELEISRMNKIYSGVIGIFFFGVIVGLNPTNNLSKVLIFLMIASFLGLLYKWNLGEKTAKMILKKPFKDYNYYKKYAKI